MRKSSKNSLVPHAPGRKPPIRLALPATPSKKSSVVWKERPWFVVIADGLAIDDEYIFRELRDDDTLGFIRSDFLADKLAQWRNEVRGGKDATVRREASQKLRRVGRALDPTEKGRKSKLPEDLPNRYDEIREALSQIKRDARTLKRQNRTWSTARILEALKQQYQRNIEQYLTRSVVSTEFGRPLTEGDRSTPWFRKQVQALVQHYPPFPGWTDDNLIEVLQGTPNEGAVAILAKQWGAAEDTVWSAIKRGRNG